jgi:hypothetical protein
MKTLAFSNTATPNGVAKLKLLGNLSIKQKQPLIYDSAQNVEYNKNPIRDLSDTNLINMYESYLTRNGKFLSNILVTTIYEHGSYIQPFGHGNYIELESMIRIPKSQSYSYIPGNLEVIKFSWMQYVSIFIPIWIFISIFTKFLYKNQILETLVLNNLPRNYKKAAL